MSDTDNDNIVYAVQSENFGDLLSKILHIITVALLPETAEIIQILPDLRGGHLHLLTEFTGRNPLNAGLLKFTEIPVITGQPLDNGFRNFFLTHNKKTSLKLLLLYVIV